MARGHPEKPRSWSELAEKFSECAALVLPKQQAHEAIALVARIEKLDSLEPLMRALRGRGERRMRKQKAAKVG